MMKRYKEPMKFHITYQFITGQKRRIYQQKILEQHKKQKNQTPSVEEQFAKLETKFLDQVDFTEEKKELEQYNSKIEVEQKNISTLKQYLNSIKELSTKLNHLQNKPQIPMNKSISSQKT